MLFATAGTGTIFPQLVRALCGQDPASEEFGERYGEQMARLLHHLNADKS